MKFQAELLLDGKTATGITVPDHVIEGLGGAKRIPVQVTINGHSYRSTIAMMRGQAMIPVSAAVRSAAGVQAGDLLDIEVTVDISPRKVTVPEDLAARLAADPEGRAFFGGLSYSRQHAYVTWIEQAKQTATRQRRVNEVAELLAQRRPQR